MIGIFDSGIGGLTVARAILEHFERVDPKDKAAENA